MVVELLAVLVRSQAVPSGNVASPLPPESSPSRFLSCLLATAIIAVLAFPDALPSLHGQSPAPATELFELGAVGVVEREIKHMGKHTYEVKLDAGQFLRFSFEVHGLFGTVTVEDPSGAMITQRRSESNEIVAHPRVEFVAEASGVHRIHIETVGWQPTGRYELHVEQLIRPDAVAARMRAWKAKETASAQWLKAHAIPLTSVEAGHGFTDLQPLKALIGNARVVALGEATHGTREIFQLKHRLLEYLVAQMGFTAFAMEVNLPESVDINHYVLTGEGDPGRALSGLYFWVWNTEEVLDLIRWMRHYNADPRHRQKIRFYGLEAQYQVRARKVVLAYLRQVDPQEASKAEQTFGVLTNPLVDHLNLAPKALRDNAHAYANALLIALDERMHDYVRRSSPAAWELVRQHVRLLVQYGGAQQRDRAMAENVAWVLQQEGPQGKVAVWAHNGHVMLTEDRLGGYLRQHFGEDLVVLGFSFNRGGFQALNFTKVPTGELQAFTVGPTPAGGLDSVLAGAVAPISAVALRAVPRSGPVAEWFRSGPLMHDVGSSYVEASPDHYFVNAPVDRMYDGLLFIEQTTPARARPAGRRTAVPALAQPANLGFEEARPGGDGAPAHWLAAPPMLYRMAAQADFGFTVATSTEKPYAGRRSGEIRRLPGKHYGEATGGLGQRIDATPYRQKRVRLRAAVRTDGAQAQAHLWLIINSNGHAVWTEAMLDRPISAAEWREYQIEANVPQNAEHLDYGLALVGEGRVWFDAVTIDAVEGPSQD